MADYFSPTVIQPTIPTTPLERLLLSHIFNAEPDGEGLYFYADEGPADMIWLDRTQLDAALAQSPMEVDSAGTAFVTEQLAYYVCIKAVLALTASARASTDQRLRPE